MRFGGAKSFAVNAIDTQQALLRGFVSERAEQGRDNPLTVLTGRVLLTRESVSAT